jgi:hypothetical protein
MVKLADAVRGGEDESVAVTVKAWLAAAVGVPVMAPVAPSSVSPGGRTDPVMLHATGAVPFAEASWAE